MVSCERAVCEQSASWWRWGYGMGRHKLWTTNLNAFYPWQFESTEILRRDPKAHCRIIRPPPSHVPAWWCTAPCRKDLYTIPGSRKCPSSSIGYILTRHVTHWTYLGFSGSTCTRDSVFQYSPTPHRHWSGTTFHRPQSTAWSTLCKGDVALHEVNGGHTKYWLVFWSTWIFKNLTNKCISVFPVMWTP
jgi:hypothetical protein